MPEQPPQLEDLQRVGAHLDAVEAALRALDEGSYGVCHRCRTPLPDQVLAADPTATDCGAHDGDDPVLSPLHQG